MDVSNCYLVPSGLQSQSYYFYWIKERFILRGWKYLDIFEGFDIKKPHFYINFATPNLSIHSSIHTINQQIHKYWAIPDMPGTDLKRGNRGNISDYNRAGSISQTFPRSVLMAKETEGGRRGKSCHNFSPYLFEWFCFSLKLHACLHFVLSCIHVCLSIKDVSQPKKKFVALVDSILFILIPLAPTWAPRRVSQERWEGSSKSVGEDVICTHDNSTVGKRGNHGADIKTGSWRKS